MIDFLLKISFNISESSPQFSFIEKPAKIKKHTEESYELLTWGDPIEEKDLYLNLRNNLHVPYIFQNISGNFYFLLRIKKSQNILFGNSLLGILPVYYFEKDSDIFLSNAALNIHKIHSSPFNKRLVLENVLFYYPLFNQSFFEDINLLPSNHYFEISNKKITINTHTAIEDLFSANPLPWRKSITHVADCFIEESTKYFPDEFYLTSLTGGFDGRTLTALALYRNLNSGTYSFGSPESLDVAIAERISSLAGIPFHKITLDKEYCKNDSLSHGLDFIMNAGGTATFARSHYLYAARKLSNITRYVLTGNFGSEAFRAYHIAGVLISPNLYNLFHAKNFEQAIIKIQNSSEWNWLNAETFKNEWESLKADLEKLPVFSKDYKHLTKNQVFYKMVFEEVFRKYFGAEMVNQYRYLINRTPYIDYKFLKTLLQTQLAGTHSDFFTHNPLKRFKGQVVYANILQKTSPLLAMELSDKGYKPADLLSASGKLRIAFYFLKKRIARKVLTEPDPYAAKHAFKTNMDYWKNFPILPDLFNETAMKKGINSFPYNRNSLFTALSQNWYLQQIFPSKK